MIRPNELARPGEREAYARVAALFERLDGYSAAELSMIPVGQLDAEARDELRADVERLAGRLGRRALMDDALEHGREALLTRFVAEFRGKTGGSSPSRDPRNEAAVLRAVSDAIAVAVVEDQLPTSDAEALAGPARTLFGDGVEDVSIDEDLAQSEGVDRGPDLPAGAPTARDWAEADHGATVIDPAASRDGRRARTRVVGGVAGIGLALVVAGVGFASGQPILGLAGLLALAAAAWSLFAGDGRG